MTGPRVDPTVGENAEPLKPLHTRAAWKVPDVLELEAEWKYKLSEEEREEIVAATRNAVATGKEPVVSGSLLGQSSAGTRVSSSHSFSPQTCPAPACQDLTKDDFPLPTVGPTLEALRDNALYGLGFQLITGGRLGRRHT